MTKTQAKGAFRALSMFTKLQLVIMANYICMGGKAVVARKAETMLPNGFLDLIKSSQFMLLTVYSMRSPKQSRLKDGKGASAQTVLLKRIFANNARGLLLSSVPG